LSDGEHISNMYVLTVNNGIRRERTDGFHMMMDMSVRARENASEM